MLNQYMLKKNFLTYIIFLNFSFDGLLILGLKSLSQIAKI